MSDVLEFAAIAAVAIIALALWNQASAAKAQAQAALTQQRGYTSLEVQAGQDILGSIFGS